MIKFIIIIIFIMFLNRSWGQQLDNSLVNFKEKIKTFLKKNEGLVEIPKNDSNYFMLYSRKVDSLCNTQISLFEIGIIGTHRKKYFCILSNKKLELFPTKNFDAEFDNIIQVLRKCNGYVSVNAISDLFISIKAIYDYNIKPPWRKNAFIKK